MGRSGFDGPWTRDPLNFNNVYYKNLLELEWVETTTSAGNLQFTDVETRELMMLPTDMAILTDPYVEESLYSSTIQCSDSHLHCEMNKFHRNAET